jgi:uncharacterized protein YpuA (DUF1002 family)
MSSRDRILDFGTLNVTREELMRLGDKRLQSEIDRILRENKIEKPELHNRKDDQTTDHYKLDLTEEDIESIASMMLDKEVFYLGLNYETTNSASFYSTMADKWNQFLIED